MPWIEGGSPAQQTCFFVGSAGTKHLEIRPKTANILLMSGAPGEVLSMLVADAGAGGEHAAGPGGGHPPSDGRRGQLRCAGGAAAGRQRGLARLPRPEARSLPPCGINLPGAILILDRMCDREEPLYVFLIASSEQCMLWPVMIGMEMGALSPVYLVSLLV